MKTPTSRHCSSSVPVSGQVANGSNRRFRMPSVLSREPAAHPRRHRRDRPTLFCTSKRNAGTPDSAECRMGRRKGVRQASVSQESMLGVLHGRALAATELPRYRAACAPMRHAQTRRRPTQATTRTRFQGEARSSRPCPAPRSSRSERAPRARGPRRGPRPDPDPHGSAGRARGPVSS